MAIFRRMCELFPWILIKYFPEINPTPIKWILKSKSEISQRKKVGKQTEIYYLNLLNLTESAKKKRMEDIFANYYHWYGQWFKGIIFRKVVNEPNTSCSCQDHVKIGHNLIEIFSYNCNFIFNISEITMRGRERKRRSK